MLQFLHIENAAVIKCADVDFEHGFMVLSGETGAGKSIVIDSINMLMGNRVSREMIRNGEEKMLVSAVFADCGDEVVQKLADYGVDSDGSVSIVRSLGVDGKGTVKINGRTVTQSLQKEVCRMLVNIHGQNDNQRLMQRTAQLEILDSYAENGTLLSEYGEAYRAFAEADEKLATWDKDASENLRMRDMLLFQLREIDEAKLKAGEEEILEVEKNRLSHVEKINDGVRFAYRALYGSEKGAVPLMDRAIAALEKISGYLPEADELCVRLRDCRYEAEDVAETVRGHALDEDPTEKLNRVESRLDLIAKLRRKYGADIAEILAFREKAVARLDTIDNADELREKWEKEKSVASEKAKLLAEALREKRRAAAKEITSRVQETLAFLDMPKVRFSIEITPAEKLRAGGGDEVEFLISANAGEPSKPLEKIASGGELSRIMLALKSVLSDKDGVGTVVFDEVDAGISGKTSRKVGVKLKEISSSVQVICVTHSAQIASLADSHFLISKEEVGGRTETSVELLDENGRVEEIARILGGIEVTELQRTTAREMIEEGKKYS